MIDLKKVFEHVTIPMSVSEPDYPNRLLYVNKAYCDLVGYSSQELIGVNPGELLQKPPYTKAREQIRAKLNNYEDSISLVLNHRKDGSTFWNELHLHPVKENNVCIYWVGTPVDVTAAVARSAAELEKVITTLKNNVSEIKTDIIEKIVIPTFNKRHRQNKRESAQFYTGQTHS